MKITTLLYTALLFLVLAAVPVAADINDVPQLAEQLYGTATVNGEDIPAGTEIWAYINGKQVASYVITTPGKIGGEGTWDGKFLISGNTNGEEISFFVNGCGYASTTVPYQKGTKKEITLTFSGKPTVYYKITKTQSEHGTYTVSAETACEGETISITPLPDTGYTFTKLTVSAKSGKTVPVSKTSFTMPASEVTLTVTFTKSGGGGGGSGGGISQQSIPVAPGPITYGGYTDIDPLSAFGILYASKLSFSGDPTYITSIDGMAEKYYGGLDGWMYAINGVAPMVSCGYAILSPGDTLIWYYSKDMNAPISASPKYIEFHLDNAGKTFTMKKHDSRTAAEKAADQFNPVENSSAQYTGNIIPASKYTIDEAGVIPPDGVVTFNTTEFVKVVSVPPSIISEYPNAQVVVTEGTEKSIELPNNASAANVISVFDISVVSEDGDTIPVSTTGTISLKITVPEGKTLIIGHLKKGDTWETCDAIETENGKWCVTYTSLSPFVAYLADAKENNPFLTNDPAPTAHPTDTQNADTQTPTKNPSPKPTASKSPMPVIAALAGVLSATLCFRRRA